MPALPPGLELVHPVPVDEAEAWTAAEQDGFLEPPLTPERMAAQQRFWHADRRWGVRDTAHGGRWVATLGSHDRRCTVPGGDVAADALTMVTVAGTHRRRGLLTAMLTDSLACARERGDQLAILMAAEWPIYGRYGYAAASWRSRFRLDPRRPGARLGPTPSTVRTVDAEELGAVAPAVFAAAAAERAGNINRPADYWARTLGLDGVAGYPERRYVLREDAEGRADGYVVWTVDRQATPDDDGHVTVLHLVAATLDAYRDLWAYVLNLDLVDQLTIRARPVDDPIRWMVPDGRSFDPVETSDALWVRLLDVPAALAARRYATPGRVVLEVVDDAVGRYGAGRVVLDGGPDGASCRPTDVDGPDLSLDQRTLAAAYLGGVSLAAQRPARPIDEHTPGALARFDTMLATPLAPWLMTDF